MLRVHGRVAFITGGASGIGFGMACAFLGAGMKVAIADVSQANLDDAAERLRAIPGDCHLLQLDVTDREAMAAVAEEVEGRFGRIHVLCNNAGVGSAAPISRATFADWDRMLAVNLFGVINGIVTFMPKLRAHGEGGHIVNTSSIAGILPMPDLGGLYTTSKFAVRGLSDSLRLALAPWNIGVSVLCPGLTRTRIREAARRNVGAAQPDALSTAFDDAQPHAMDPLLVGKVVLEGIERNDAYILPHAEFIDEVRALHEAIVADFRTDIEIDPARAAFENSRRKLIDDIKASIADG